MNIDLTSIVLKYGAHASRDDGMCAMEAAAYVAGEKHSDRPTCVSEVIGTFMRTWNDSLPDDATRTRLLVPLIQRILNTAASHEVELRRSWMAVDWLVRVYTPAWLELAGLAEHADALRALSPIVDAASVCANKEPLKSARTARPTGYAVGYATWSATWSATGDAAWDATGDAAIAAVSDAAITAVSAAAATTGDAAAAPTIEMLQTSAADLVSRMAALSA